MHSLLHHFRFEISFTDEILTRFKRLCLLTFCSGDLPLESGPNRWRPSDSHYIGSPIAITPRNSPFLSQCCITFPRSAVVVTVSLPRRHTILPTSTPLSMALVFSSVCGISLRRAVRIDRVLATSILPRLRTQHRQTRHQLTEHPPIRTVQHHQHLH